ncbi:glycosyltransferase family 4 protein [Patescibacteria group bacterium]|nr:glycosyltransferase family 4 protein [Patescibacteria group bacterium]
MNIVISTYDEINNPYYSGGGARSTHEIAKRLTEHHHVTILCGAYKDCRDSVIDGVEYKHIGLKISNPKLGQLIFSFLLPFYALKQEHDLWIENFTPPHSTNFIQLFTKKPVIGQTSLLHAREFSQKYKLPFHVVEGIGLKKYRYFSVQTKQLKKKIRSVNSLAEIYVIPRGVDKKLFNLKTKEENFVLFLGRLDVFQKGLDLLLKSWAQASKEMKGVKLVIAGAGTSRDEKALKKLVQKYGLDRKIKFTGLVAGKEKEQLLSHCLFAVCPSRFEGFGITALEVLVVGKPLVCFDIDGFKWIPKGMCVKVSPFNTIELSNKMTALAQNKKLRTKLQSKTRKFVRGHDWDTIAKQYEDMIVKISKK